MTFAKIFDSEKHGQLLLKEDVSEEGNPELRLYFQINGESVCSVALHFKDNEDGWKRADAAFAEFSLELAEDLMKSVPQEVFDLYK